MSMLNEIVAVDFLDHTMGDITVKPEPCTVFGRLIKIEPQYIVVQFWESKDSEDDTEAFSIVMSTISEIKVLRKFLA